MNTIKRYNLYMITCIAMIVFGAATIVYDHALSSLNEWPWFIGYKYNPS